MANVKVIIEAFIQSDIFTLQIKHFGKSKLEQPFTFFNAYKAIESKCLKIEDKNGKILEPDGKGHISLKNWDDINVMISDTKPFIYNSTAEIEEIDERLFLLNFITAAYILKKGELYYMYLHYLDEVTDKIEVVF